jgi:hypothetical protein
MHAIESIGPLLGIIAFVGLVVLAFLLFQQGRDLRHLREWAGRAPERAGEAADAVQAAAESRREPGTAEELAPAEATGYLARLRGRLAAGWGRIADSLRPRLTAVDRRLPVDGRYLLAAAAVGLAATAVLTSGFGLVGESSKRHNHGHGSGAKPEVAVLNGTSVPGLAAQVQKQVVSSAGYKAGTVTNADASFARTVVMYLPGKRDAAKTLATAVRPKLGTAAVQEMATAIRERADGAPLALILGLDDSRFGAG